eukprot:290217_1
MAQELKVDVTKTPLSSTTTGGQAFNNHQDLHWVIEEMKECVDDGIVNWSLIKQQLFPSINNNQSSSPIDKDHIVALHFLEREIQHHFYIYVKQKLTQAVPSPDTSSLEQVKWLTLTREPSLSCQWMQNDISHLGLVSISDLSKQLSDSRKNKSEPKTLPKSGHYNDKVDKKPIKDNIEINDEKTTNQSGEFCDDLMDITELKKRCEPFQRIAMMLQAYKDLLSNTNKNEMKLFENIQTSYNHQQLFNDFLHVKVMHIDADNAKIRSHDHLEYDKPAQEHIGIDKKICQYFA